MGSLFFLLYLGKILSSMFRLDFSLFSIAGLASLGLPGTAGFAAEFITFAGSFTSIAVAGMKIFTLIAVIGVVVTSGYILWMLQRVFYGHPLDKYNDVKDADAVEMIATFSVVAVIMLIGIYPAILTNVIYMGIEPIAKLIGM